MKDLARIQNTSRALFCFYSVLLLVIPISVAIYWTTLNGANWGLPRVIAQLDVQFPESFSAITLLLGFCASMLPTSVVMYGLYQLRRLFQLYSTGSFFSVENCICMRNVSIALLIWTPVRMVFDALISVALTATNAPGQRFVAVGIQEPELTALLLGVIFLVITWVMVAAGKLQEDSAGIV